MTTDNARRADERGYRAMLIRTDGRRPSDEDIIDMIADVLIYAERGGRPADYIVNVAMSHVRAELDGDDLTTGVGR